ncbi:MAG: SSI family serine proteinase inhibitor [Jiangellaceae bacterium]
MRTATTTTRPARLVAQAAMTLALASALAGCGGDDGEATVVTTTPAILPEQPQTSLTIAVSYGEAAQPDEWTLTCDPTGGTHPDPAEACAALAELDLQILEPVAADQTCTQVYGGPETATVRGTWQGEPVDASFSRQNGCEIARWDAVTALVG